MYVDPLIRIPSFEAAPMPPKKVSGTETTSAQGHDAIRKVSALTTQIDALPTKSPENSGGKNASAIAP